LAQIQKYDLHKHHDKIVKIQSHIRGYQARKQISTGKYYQGKI